MRESGILMPVSSLPGPYGIGCFGKEAFKFVDFLAQAGQKIWQILPLSPTGYGDSPYQSCSAFAGNPYFIDLDALKEEGLLTAAQLKAEKWGTDPKEVDYGTLYVSRFKVLRTAYAAWRKQCTGLHGCSYYFPDDYYAFTLANEEWLDDYALYMALKVANGMKNWVEWDKPYRLRDKKALAAFAAENEEEIGFWKFVQYKFAAQWQAVKAYANKKDVQILGDIPIYVSADSVDAWVGGALFELDADGGFARVAGCPPDYFSADGQLWGNPLYNWAYHKKTGYAWWVRRVRHALGIYDLLRIDHFRGFDTYWAIPADSTTARTGRRYVPSPARTCSPVRTPSRLSSPSSRWPKRTSQPRAMSSCRMCFTTCRSTSVPTWGLWEYFTSAGAPASTSVSSTAAMRGSWVPVVSFPSEKVPAPPSPNWTLDRISRASSPFFQKSSTLFVLSSTASPCSKRIGAQPFSESASAANIPAGPAPMITGRFFISAVPCSGYAYGREPSARMFWFAAFLMTVPSLLLFASITSTI